MVKNEYQNLEKSYESQGDINNLTRVREIIENLDKNEKFLDKNKDELLNRLNTAKAKPIESLTYLNLDSEDYKNYLSRKEDINKSIKTFNNMRTQHARVDTNYWKNYNRKDINNLLDYYNNNDNNNNNNSNNN